MTSRLLLSVTLASAVVRRKRKADGVIFAVAGLRDTDSGAPRQWTPYANDPALIEQLEELRIGEPIAVTGPFAIAITGLEREPTIEYRITGDALLDAKRRRKPKGQICKEESAELDEIDAPKGTPFDDALPF